jgi:biopolymer transport protein TolQ
MKGILYSIGLLCSLMVLGPSTSIFAQGEEAEVAAEAAPSVGEEGAIGSIEAKEESELVANSIFIRAWQGGFIVFMVLFILVVSSMASWAIVVGKYIYLKKLGEENDKFIKSFWESRSLNDLNSKLSEYADSPSKEVFRAGYAELVKGSHLKEQATVTQLAINAAIGNLGRSLGKAKNSERRQMEKYLPILATIASAGPFIGLFGTVWGIMGAFEGIARSGSASLAAVAPGISEALIATAFGLAAAIPAAIGYNMANHRIKYLLSLVDGFSADFLNIVERYLVSDKKNQTSASGL